MYSYNVDHSKGKWISLDIFCYITYSFINKLRVKTEPRPVNHEFLFAVIFIFRFEIWLKIENRMLVNTDAET